jgi:hypothetical protein
MDCIIKCSVSFISGLIETLADGLIARYLVGVLQSNHIGFKIGSQQVFLFLNSFIVSSFVNA